MRPNINDHRLNDSSYLPHAPHGGITEFGNSSLCPHAVLDLCVLGKSSNIELQTRLSGNAFASERALVNMEVDSVGTKGHSELMICWHTFPSRDGCIGLTLETLERDLSAFPPHRPLH